MRNWEQVCIDNKGNTIIHIYFFDGKRLKLTDVESGSYKCVCSYQPIDNKYIERFYKKLPYGDEVSHYHLFRNKKQLFYAINLDETAHNEKDLIKLPQRIDPNGREPLVMQHYGIKLPSGITDVIKNRYGDYNGGDYDFYDVYNTTSFLPMAINFPNEEDELIKLLT